MNGWMDGWMDGWGVEDSREGWRADGWRDGELDGWREGCRTILMDERME